MKNFEDTHACALLPDTAQQRKIRDEVHALRRTQQQQQKSLKNSLLAGVLSLCVVCCASTLSWITRNEGGLVFLLTFSAFFVQIVFTQVDMLKTGRKIGSKSAEYWALKHAQQDAYFDSKKDNNA